MKVLPYSQTKLHVLVPATHHLASQSSVYKKELNHESLVVPKILKDVIDETNDRIVLSGCLPISPIVVADIESIFLTVASNLGIGVVPHFSLNLLNGFPTLRAIPVKSKYSTINVALFWNPENTSGAVANFIDYLKKHI